MGKQISNNDLESICLDTVEDVNIWLWQVAAKGQVLSKTMREQILSRVGNDDIRAYVQHIIPLFNHLSDNSKDSLLVFSKRFNS